MNDLENESLYLQAENEFETGNLNQGLWIKAQVETEGDKEKAKFKYLELRVLQLTTQQTSGKISDLKNKGYRAVGFISGWILKYLAFCVGIFLVIVITRYLIR